MKRLSILTLTMIALAGFMATTVRADSPHFIKVSSSFDTKTGEFCVTFKEAGLGNTPVTYVLSAPGSTFVYQCFTKSNNTPQGSPNGVSPSDVSTSTTITPRNGQVSATICLTPQQDGASCQGGGLVLRLVGTDYDNISFTDGLGNTVTFDDVCSGQGCVAPFGP